MGKRLKFPKELLEFFVDDPERALRDLASVSSRAISPFIRRTDRLIALMQAAIKNPFDEQQMQFSLNYACAPQDEALRYIHVDLALSGDACGISMAHVSGRRATVVKEKDRRVVLSVPEVTVDFTGRILAPRGGEIEFSMIRELIYDLTRRDFLLALITYDGFQSADSIQILRREGYVTARMSIDRTANVIVVSPRDRHGFVTRTTEQHYLAAYVAFRELMYAERLVVPYHEYMFKEARWAERDAKTGKMSYPAYGSDDVFQAVCGAILNAVTNEGPTEVDEENIQSDIISRARGKDPWVEDYRENVPEIHTDFDSDRASEKSSDLEITDQRRKASPWEV